MNATTSLADAQHDMRDAYAGGAFGLLASATAWLVAGVIAANNTAEHAVLALFLGGMAIHPASMLLSRLTGRRGNHAAGNPLGRLALEGTILMIMLLPLAYIVSRDRIEWFFPAMLLIIGGRYLTFATIYGMRVYWACGMALALAAWALVASLAPVAIGAFTGAAIEAAFAVVVLTQFRRARG